MTPEGDQNAAGEQTAADAQQTDDPEQIREEIAQTRAELGDTVDALSDKADVRGQASAKVDEQKERLRGAAERVTDMSGDDVREAGAQLASQAQTNPAPFIAGGFVAGLIFGRLTKRR